MPRKSRTDAPGAFHHIIARGIERSDIFKDNTDRNNFLNRLGKIIKETNTCCFGWALIPNHFHLLLKTGDMPISTKFVCKARRENSKRKGLQINRPLGLKLQN
ncbi:MAG: hypothetical protein Q7J15_01730 [Candidatus Desulfaltia sp.]|nr:hypothetical protein [Candidatus Desulfaltia sp.]